MILRCRVHQIVVFRRLTDHNRVEILQKDLHHHQVAHVLMCFKIVELLLVVEVVDRQETMAMVVDRHQRWVHAPAAHDRNWRRQRPMTHHHHKACRRRSTTVKARRRRKVSRRPWPPQVAQRCRHRCAVHRPPAYHRPWHHQATLPTTTPTTTATTIIVVTATTTPVMRVRRRATTRCHRPCARRRKCARRHGACRTTGDKRAHVAAHRLRLHSADHRPPVDVARRLACRRHNAVHRPRHNVRPPCVRRPAPCRLRRLLLLLLLLLLLVLTSSPPSTPTTHPTPPTTKANAPSVLKRAIQYR
mmetsp:Transcript_21035/g.35777  ORF Transcript_21035/g.35777 Transcript_21035/m.35777 type:complete len:302 (+) Transcript_21035:2085-2990(+)